MKTCNMCNQEKNYDDFTALYREPDGLNPTCKACSYKTRKYHVEKFDQWVALKKKAKKEGQELLFTQNQFYSFILENKEKFRYLAEVEELTPYADLIDGTLPYTIDNLHVVGRPRLVLAVVGKKANGDTINFKSLREAAKTGYSRKKIGIAIKQKVPYMDFNWEYV